MSKARELREMSDEQIRLVWKDSAETLFKLRLQGQTEKLTAPTDVKKHRRTIARCQTLLAQRGSAVLPATEADGSVDPSKAAHDVTLHDKHAHKKRASGRARVKTPAKGDVQTKRRFQKRTQSGE